MSQFMRIAVLLSLSAVLATAQIRTAQVSVEVRPAMLVTQTDPSNVQLALRLAPTTQAFVWRADTCGVAPADALQVSQSGRTQVNVTSLGTGSKLCAVSSDGKLSQTLDLVPTN